MYSLGDIYVESFIEELKNYDSYHIIKDTNTYQIISKVTHENVVISVYNTLNEFLRNTNNTCDCTLSVHIFNNVYVVKTLDETFILRTDSNNNIVSLILFQLLREVIQPNGKVNLDMIVNVLMGLELYPDLNNELSIICDKTDKCIRSVMISLFLFSLIRFRVINRNTVFDLLKKEKDDELIKLLKTLKGENINLSNYEYVSNFINPIRVPLIGESINFIIDLFNDYDKNIVVSLLNKLEYTYIVPDKYFHNIIMTIMEKIYGIDSNNYISNLTRLIVFKNIVLHLMEPFENKENILKIYTFLVNNKIKPMIAFKQLIRVLSDNELHILLSYLLNIKILDTTDDFGHSFIEYINVLVELHILFFKELERRNILNNYTRKYSIPFIIFGKVVRFSIVDVYKSVKNIQVLRFLLRELIITRRNVQSLKFNELTGSVTKLTLTISLLSGLKFCLKYNFSLPLPDINYVIKITKNKIVTVGEIDLMNLIDKNNLKFVQVLIPKYREIFNNTKLFKIILRYNPKIVSEIEKIKQEIESDYFILPSVVCDVLKLKGELEVLNMITIGGEVKGELELLIDTITKLHYDFLNTIKPDETEGDVDYLPLYYSLEICQT